MPRILATSYLFLFILGIAIDAAGATDSTFHHWDSTAQVIYQRLQEAVGDKEADWPLLNVWSIEDRGALFVPKSNTIYLDQKLISCCSSFGKQAEDALAFVIAHEMTHFYQAHDWKTSGLVQNFMIARAAFDAHRQDEIQADIYGAFVSYQAGFNSIVLVPKLLDRIYKAYQLDTAESLQYPSLKERRDLANHACDLASNLIEVYHTAIYLMVIGNFEAAHSLFQYVSDHVQFKELHYNLGLCNMMAYQYLQKIPLKYPLSVDTDIPIQRKFIQKSPDKLLQEASHSFSLVLDEYDEDYFPAQIQLMTVYDWMGDRERSEQQIEILKSKREVRENPAFIISLANCYARNGSRIEALRILKAQIADLNSAHSTRFRHLANHNIDLLEGNLQQQVRRSFSITNEGPLDGVKSLVFYDQFQNHIKVHSSIDFSTGQEYGSTISKLTWDDLRFYLQRIYDPDVKSVRGIGVGNEYTDIVRLYQDSNLKRSAHLEGTFVIIYQKGLIFKLDQSETITEWCSFTY